jgi:large subunit ribosomal protein L9
MKVILLTDVPRVGQRYDVKDFKEGYAINVLISRGLAELATPKALALLNDKKAEIARKKNEEAQIFKSLVNSINSKSITIKAKTSEKGSLFKSVSETDFIEALRKEGIEVDKGAISMPHIKKIGEYKVGLRKGDISRECRLVVESL